jgi:nucleotidyltransferase/DNA polymerase involved in DNA repair
VVVCVLIPRFELLAAVGTRRELLRSPAALAPEPDRAQVVGEVSGAAQALGIHPGMRVGEALARCPGLRLIPPDPERAARAWDAVLAGLEEIGAAVEPAAPGEAYFDAAALHRLYGGHLEGVLSRARRAVPAPARWGAATSRFCAYAAARGARPGSARPGRRAKIVPTGAERAFLAPLSVSLLPHPLGAELAPVLERLGIRALGELAALSSGALADRFGERGLRARELALGRDTALRPRAPGERLMEEIELPEAVSGLQLQRALELLIDRILARPERRERTLRALRLGARFVERGTWRREVPLREASVSRERLRLALIPKLDELPAPIEQLSVTVVAYGSPVADQLSFQQPDEQERRNRLAEALRQTRAAAGPESVLRVLEGEPDSRVPERRAFLTPFAE